MKYMKACLFVAVSISLLFTACSNRHQGNRMGKQLYTMQELSHKVFSLDDSTTQVLEYIHTFEENDSLLLASFNKPLNNICIFDVKSGKEIRKIQFRKEGPNALGSNMFGFLYQNKDSIFIYQTWVCRVDLFNSRGEIVDKYNLSDMMPSKDCPYVTPDILPRSYSPIKKVGANIILPGQGGQIPDPNPNGLREAVTTIFNVEDSTIRYANSYPSVYGNAGMDWQVFAYRIVPYDLSPRGEMVLGFPADDSIRVYNIRTGEAKSYFAGYSLPYEIRPAHSTSEVDMARSVFEQAQYAALLYDRWNRLYYRVVALPLPDYDVNSPKRPARNLAVVILDEDFQKVGEYNIKEKSNLYAYSFTSPEGLHIQVLSDDDDYMTFMTIKPQKL